MVGIDQMIWKERMQNGHPPPHLVLQTIAIHISVTHCQVNVKVRYRITCSFVTAEHTPLSCSWLPNSMLQFQINNFYHVFAAHAVDPELVNQIFRQLFYYITAGALNNLLLRKDLCHWSKGMQIRYNISHLECFIRDNNLVVSYSQWTCYINRWQSCRNNLFLFKALFTISYKLLQHTK